MATVETTEVRPGRGAELGLLVLALALGIGAYALVGLQLTGELPGRFYLYSIGTVVLAGAAHVLLRFKAPYADPVILPIAVALNGIGLAMIFRLDLGSQVTGGTQDLAPRQLQWTALGILCAFAVIWFLRDHRTLRRYTYTAMIAGIVLVALPLVPGLGTRINGAQIWINVFGFSLQPAEFAKIAFAIFFAGYLVTNRDTLALAGPKVLGLQLPRLRDLGPIIIVWLVSLAILVFERDLGTSLLFFGLFVAMLYIATERVSWVVIGLLLIAVGAVLAASTFGHVQARVDVWLHPFVPEIYGRSPGGSGQLVGGLFSLGNGGLFGTGWGAGYPRTVPYAFSDFIYASLGEELGLTGLIGILLAYLILVERGLRTAIGVRDGFGKLLAGGLAFVMAWQLFVVVGGITRIIPLTGLTMPFVAQGGSSLLANWLVVGLLLRISDDARRPSSLPVRGQVAPGGARTRPDSDPVEVVGGGAPAVGALPDDAPTTVGAPVPAGPGTGPARASTGVQPAVGRTGDVPDHADDLRTEVVRRPDGTADDGRDPWGGAR
ncbi:FtsW/RodA/SpoVE family cell cycle protein [Cellulosimicrobium protaetiae]|uniref:FtsW/RodA/SpoVE family cell cycle protein n=1 Tax=Cellulosimicrobium protaetiae TaxID=2587808 RepID=A0A6M5UCW0_9MICO|nr:FtsW/RodA/SpoVE family cell cycle protein [Cellulosimicrobium protaetiae]QJW35171.1 FtsW/RodA/SpoVE family cell cycle protein [Cellulosimicrobium protaetiae]